MKEFTSKLKFTAKIVGYTALFCGMVALLGASVGLPLWVGGVAGFITMGVVCG